MNETNVGGMLDILKLWRNGTIADAMELFDAVKSKDVARIRGAVVKIAAGFGYQMEAKELDDVVAGILAHDWPRVVYESGDAMMKFAVLHMGYVPPGGSGIKVMGPTEDADNVVNRGVPMNVKNMTREQSRQWYADHRSVVRDGAGSWVGHFLLRRVPEIRERLANDGTATVTAIDPERLAKIVDILRIVANVCAAAGTVYPPLIAVATVLKLVIAFYDANHPTGGLTADGDHGLEVSDL